MELIIEQIKGSLDKKIAYGADVIFGSTSVLLGARFISEVINQTQKYGAPDLMGKIDIAFISTGLVGGGAFVAYKSLEKLALGITKEELKEERESLMQDYKENRFVRF